MSLGHFLQLPPMDKVCDGWETDFPPDTPGTCLKFRRVPIPGGPLVTFKIKNYFHQKYSLRILISVYCSSVQSTQHSTPQHTTNNKQTNKADNGDYIPTGLSMDTNRRVIDNNIIITAKSIIESSIVLYVMCDLIACLRGERPNGSIGDDRTIDLRSKNNRQL